MILTLQMDRAVGGFAKTESTKNESIACYVLSALLLGTSLSGSVMTVLAIPQNAVGPAVPAGFLSISISLLVRQPWTGAAWDSPSRQGWVLGFSYRQGLLQTVPSLQLVKGVPSGQTWPHAPVCQQSESWLLALP